MRLIASAMKRAGTNVDPIRNSLVNFGQHQARMRFHGRHLWERCFQLLWARR